MEFQNFSVDLNAAENLHPELRMKAEPRRLPGFLDCGGLIRRMQIDASEKRRGSKKELDSALGGTRNPCHSGSLERGVFLEACDDANGEPSAISPTLLPPEPPASLHTHDFSAAPLLIPSPSLTLLLSSFHLNLI